MMLQLLGLLALAFQRADEVVHVDASLELDGRLLSWDSVRGLPGGEHDLVLALRKDGVRELRVHAIEAQRVDPVPRLVVPMLDDVVAWGVAELRSEAGRELLLLTPGGAFSYSFGKEGYRDNALPLARTELLYDLANPSALPRWRYILPALGADGRDGLLLPERGALVLWSPQADAPGHARSATFPRRAAGSAAQASSSVAGAEPGAEESEPESSSGEARRGGPFLSLESDVLLADSHSYRAPALVDLAGDGGSDLVDFDGKSLFIHLDAAEQPSRVEALPAYLREENTELSLSFHDLDGDGDLDLLARIEARARGLGNRSVKLVALLNDGRVLLPGAPSQMLRFEASRVRAGVRDIDGDGRPDLIVNTFTMPSLLATVTGPEFTLTQMVFFGESGGFARQAAVRYEQKFDESGAAAAIARYHWVLDCDGDGIADLCAVDLLGRIHVRRLQKRSGFLRGTRWELDAEPWRSFDTQGSGRALSVRDLNGDGLGDLVSTSEQRLSIFLSLRPGAKR